MRRMLIALPPLSAFAPLALEVSRLSPTPLRAREQAQLTLRLTGSLESCGGPWAGGQVETENVVEMEVHPSARGDWLVVGPHRQRVRLSAAADSDAADSSSCLSWMLIPLRAGYL